MNFDFYDACQRGEIRNLDLLDKNTIADGFLYACSAGQLKVVEWLISKGIEDIYGCSSACRNGHLDVVKYLVSQNKCEYNRCIISACLGNHLEIVQFLMTTNCITNYSDPLFYSYKWKHWKIVEFLISNRAVRSGTLCLESACYLCWLTDAQTYDLLEMGASICTFLSHKDFKRLLNEIQNFKERTRAFLVTQDSLVPDLCNLIVEYSLK